MVRGKKKKSDDKAIEEEEPLPEVDTSIETKESESEVLTTDEEPQEPIQAAEADAAKEMATPIPKITSPAEIPAAYEIEYRTRVRFPVPEILAAADEIGKKISVLEEELAAIKAYVSLIQDRIARGFDITESSSAIFGSDEAADGMERPLSSQKSSQKEEEPKELDDSFMTLL